MAEKLPSPLLTRESTCIRLLAARRRGADSRWLSIPVCIAIRGSVPFFPPLFPGKTLRCAIEELTAFLVQLSGGPSADTQRRWWLSLRESHQRFKLRQEERAAWMENMVKALDDARIEEPLRSALREFFEQSSAHVEPPPNLRLTARGQDDSSNGNH